MRLICPRCGAQYEIDAAAIPQSGRDVECSACDHVWRAGPADPAGSAAFDPEQRPPLSRPLSESVIEILREEAARELEARAAERAAGRGATPAAALVTDEPRADADSSVVAPMPPAVAEAEDPATIAARAAVAARAAARPEPRLHIAAVSMSEPAPSQPALAAPQPAVPQLAAAAPVAAPVAPTRRQRSRRRHDAGYHLAVMVALVALALYLLAPRMAGQGEIGAALNAWRAQVDAGRDWLADRADASVARLRRSLSD